MAFCLMQECMVLESTDGVEDGSTSHPERHFIIVPIVYRLNCLDFCGIHRKTMLP